MVKIRRAKACENNCVLCPRDMTCLISKLGTAHSNGFTEYFYTVALAVNHPCLASSYINPLSSNAPKCALLYYCILLCLTPDYFTPQGESANTQWVNQTICPCILLTL